jgi:hypothetical protein
LVAIEDDAGGRSGSARTSTVSPEITIRPPVSVALVAAGSFSSAACAMHSGGAALESQSAASAAVRARRGELTPAARFI